MQWAVSEHCTPWFEFNMFLGMHWKLMLFRQSSGGTRWRARRKPWRRRARTGRDNSQPADVSTSTSKTNCRTIVLLIGPLNTPASPRNSTPFWLDCKKFYNSCPWEIIFWFQSEVFVLSKSEKKFSWTTITKLFKEVSALPVGCVSEI